MSDFTSGFWEYLHLHGFDVLLGIFGCGAVCCGPAIDAKDRKGIPVEVTRRHRHQMSTPQMAKTTTATFGTRRDLTELNTPMPRWWMWLFYLTIVFGIG